MIFMSYNNNDEAMAYVKHKLEDIKSISRLCKNTLNFYMLKFSSGRQLGQMGVIR